MKPQNLAMIVVGSVVGFFALAGTAVFLAWNISPAEADNRNRFVGRRAMERRIPMQPDFAQMPDMAQMPEWKVDGFAAARQRSTGSAAQVAA